MCGRYALIQTDELAEHFDIGGIQPKELLGQLRPRYNIAPEQILPVITEQEGERQLEFMQWGFMPPWAKSTRDIYKYNTFNARSEGVFSKPLWKRSALMRRCLVPTSGFYEWRQTSSGKQPYFIHLRQQGLFAFAGIYRYWREADDMELGTYAILTTEANYTMSLIHNRMPVILHRSDEETWINPTTARPQLEMLTAPYPDNELDIYAVSRDVNTARTDAETLVAPINSR